MQSVLGNFKSIFSSMSKETDPKKKELLFIKLLSSLSKLKKEGVSNGKPQ